MLLLPRIAQIVTLMLLATLTGVDASAAQARLPRIAIQPVHGAPGLVGASLRAQIAHLVRARGFRVVSTTASVENSVQYAALAQDRGVSAFVIGDLNRSKRRHMLTIVVLDGERGSVLGRWSVGAPPKNPGKFLASGFWKHLGPALATASAPARPFSSPPSGMPMVTSTPPKLVFGAGAPGSCPSGRPPT
jgi:hypothetical protein